ncbi:MAG TPA: hypothetical protein VFJ97_07650 [Dermatophilaceae bacterium]|nr:hypothetical protein [Dermatophilaceae bacterium]
MLMGGYVVMACLALVLALVANALPSPLGQIVVTTLAVAGAGLLTLALCHAVVRLQRDAATGDVQIRFGYGAFANALCFLAASAGFIAATR